MFEFRNSNKSSRMNVSVDSSENTELHAEQQPARPLVLQPSRRRSFKEFTAVRGTIFCSVEVLFYVLALSVRRF